MFNLPQKKHQKSLKKLFKRQRVAQLSDLRTALGVRSRTTVFFALKAAGYHVSYSHAGRYYTLVHIPRFDANGLWSCNDVRFSKHGTLRAAVVVLVKTFSDGRTHEELQVLLGLRIHDTLRSLVSDALLGRARIGAAFVYTDPNPERMEQQLELRRRMKSDLLVFPSSPPPLDVMRVIDILVATLQAPKDDATTIAARLQLNDIVVTADQVEATLTHYGVEKKTARSRSKR